jgi:hypothetical protein
MYRLIDEVLDLIDRAQRDEQTRDPPQLHQ